MLQLGRGVRLAAAGTRSMRAAAETTTSYLYRECIDPATSAPACAMVRFYKTHAFAGLPGAEQLFARKLLPDTMPSPRMKCLTMLASAGDQPEWNSPPGSR